MTWPFENDTSAIVKKLAGRSMQADKRNKAFLLLTIAISVCMVFSILLISTGTQEEFKNTQRNKAQIGILGDTDEQTALLRQNGYKVTPQRLAVYEALANTKQHPSAEMLFGTLQPKYPSMSFATVYKTVEILNKLGLIQIINTGEDSFRYDADISEHSHVQCTVCGRVDDVPALNDRSLVVKVEEASGYSIDKHQFYFFGVCEKCRKKH